MVTILAPILNFSSAQPALRSSSFCAAAQGRRLASPLHSMLTRTTFIYLTLRAASGSTPPHRRYFGVRRLTDQAEFFVEIQACHTLREELQIVLDDLMCRFLLVPDQFDDGPLEGIYAFRRARGPVISPIFLGCLDQIKVLGDLLNVDTSKSPVINSQTVEIAVFAAGWEVSDFARSCRFGSISLRFRAGVREGSGHSGQVLIPTAR